MAKPRSISGRKPKQEMHLFGSAEEIAQRLNDEALYSAGGDVQNHPPSFKQIPPQSGSGSVNRAGLKHRSGEMKFSGGPGKL
jgi:hypothetical protein